MNIILQTRITIDGKIEEILEELSLDDSPYNKEYSLKNAIKQHIKRIKKFI